MALSTDIQAALAAVAKYMTVEPAPELPVDQEVAQLLATQAVASGFAASTGQFMVAISQQPISTLILFVNFAGGASAVLPKQ